MGVSENCTNKETVLKARIENDGAWVKENQMEQTMMGKIPMSSPQIHLATRNPIYDFLWLGVAHQRGPCLLVQAGKASLLGWINFILSGFGYTFSICLAKLTILPKDFHFVSCLQEQNWWPSTPSGLVCFTQFSSTLRSAERMFK